MSLILTMGSCDAMYSLVTDFWRKKKLTDFLLRSFGRKLFQFPQFLVGRIVDYGLAPAPPTYFIADMMNFIPGDGHVTTAQVLAKIDQVWNDYQYPTWFEAPRTTASLPKFSWICIIFTTRATSPPWRKRSTTNGTT